jgi:hypothetical protein
MGVPKLNSKVAMSSCIPPLFRHPPTHRSSMGQYAARTSSSPKVYQLCSGGHWGQTRSGVPLRQERAPTVPETRSELRCTFSRGSGPARCRGFGTCGWEVVGRTWTRRPSIPYHGAVRREGSGLQLEELHVWLSARKANSDTVKGRDTASARRREAAPAARAAGWTLSRRRPGSAAGNSGQPL